MFNQFPYYRHHNYYNRYNNYAPTFTNYYNPHNQEILNNTKKEVEENQKNKEDNTINSSSTSKKEKTSPLDFSGDRIKLFNITIQIDDLLIIGLILILLFEKEKNYPLIIVLGLILFNFDFSSLHFF